MQTKIVKSNGETTTLNYLMRQNQGSWQISDVYLDGTISQLAVQRSEFYLDPAARRGRGLGHGVEPQGRPAEPGRRQVVLARVRRGHAGRTLPSIRR